MEKYSSTVLIFPLGEIYELSPTVSKVLIETKKQHLKYDIFSFC
jgi:hypothetical protein